MGPNNVVFQLNDQMLFQFTMLLTEIGPCCKYHIPTIGDAITPRYALFVIKETEKDDVCLVAN